MTAEKVYSNMRIDMLLGVMDLIYVLFNFSNPPSLCIAGRRQKDESLCCYTPNAEPESEKIEVHKQQWSYIGAHGALQAEKTGHLLVIRRERALQRKILREAKAVWTDI